MKLTTLLLFACLFQINASTYSQKTRITLDIKNESIESILFEKIEHVTDFKFFYENSALDLGKKVTFKFKKKRIDEVLKIVFKNTNIDFDIIDKQIILTKRKILPIKILEPSTPTQSGTLKWQNTINGTVKDANGENLPGANILEKGTTNGSQADFDGNFSINVSNINATLVVSYIGYVTKEVPLNGQSNVNIVLEESTFGLEEVVAIGFGRQKKESVVGAIESIKPAELDVPIRSLSNSLAGRVSGVLAVQRSGEPGKDDAQFWIRGISTFTGNQNPLVLVDGIERPLSDVDPIEIESFSVLKDASATAVYGVRGANGVILVNTRKGVKGEAKIDARLEQGWAWATKRPSYLNAFEQATLFNEGIDATPGSSQSLKFSQEALDAFRDHTDLELYPDVDWQEALMQDITATQKLSVNISGGGEKARYFVATSVYNQEGQYNINPGEYSWVSSSIGDFGSNVKYLRYNFRSNVDMDLSESTTVSLGLQGNISENKEPAGDVNEGSDSVYNWIVNSSPYAYPLQYKDGQLAQREVMQNPYNLLTQRGHMETIGNVLRSNLSIQQNLNSITEGLSANMKYAFDAVNWNRTERLRNIEYITAIGRNEDGELNYNTYGTADNTDYLNYSSTAWGDRTQYFETSLNYDNAFDKHSFGGLILFNMRSFSTNTSDSYINSLPNRSLGLSGRVTYAYDSKYFIETNLGYNGSENFPKGQRMGFFPSLAVGWLASKEEFLEDNEVVTWLKLRGSLGQVGSDQIGSTRFAYLSTIVGAPGYSGFGQNYDQGIEGLQEDQIGSTDITWEVATKYNLGIELGLYRDLRINTDIFYEKRENIFLQPQTSEVEGIRNSIWSNDGVMENKGFDMSIEYSRVLGDLTLTARGNFTYARNKILEDGRYYANSWQDARGTRYGERLLYDAEHLFSEEEIQALPDYYDQFSLDKTQLRPGDIKYRDVNDDGKINEDDRIFAANPSTPDVVFGFGASMEYKNFDFSFLFQGSAGASSYINAAWYFYPFQADRDPKYLGSLIDNFQDRWTPENPDPNAFAPRLYVGQDQNNYKASTWWVRDANYLRLRNLELGYTFSVPENFIKIDKSRIYLTGVNLVTFSKFAKDFWDPETGAAAYPIQASLFLGFNVSF
ncbi:MULTISPECIES: TonB-dependent receptor [unclassified Arenibacter]|uniref:SusC/RagA family TonB-linked outer membrane protein n=1 Tax=unclassified Arenibacter TaxID=2615047 RepID=UPI000E354485|nr:MULTISPECIES: TonB-dependent receptor [unclassified Arenibacter]MCM4163015.1 SusC/RagA family TonB-linked outer membrane protein [Arenibacter sp. A80]RFT57549.1 TonB-dependent receptor [Arenibacter sp. P308M17]